MSTKKIFLTKCFNFDSAHNLTDYQGGCENLHGHTYRLETTVSGKLSEDGMIIDFKNLKGIVEKNILEKLDHQYLNEVVPSRTTSENIALWIWSELEPYIELINCTLERITLFETPDSKIEIVREKH